MTVGVLLVGYGSREACMAETLSMSPQGVRLFIADRQRNPLNVRLAAEHVVVNDMNVEEIFRFAERHAHELDFVLVGPEAPIIAGIRDIIEGRLHIPVIAPSKAAAVEGSKSRQRQIIERVAPDANPPFKVFPRDVSTSPLDIRKELKVVLSEFGEVVVKPDYPASGKGVGVWGDHFSTAEDFIEYFSSLYSQGPVIVEKKVDGEEFSLQFLSDSKHLVPVPAVRDYKRAFDNDVGPNTGGMGSYKDVGETLPFMSFTDLERGVEVAKRLFEALIAEAGEGAMRGFPLYMAYAISRDGLKVFEINSRAGDPEIMCVLTLLEDDFADTCFRMIDGTLDQVHLKRMATVITYLVPQSYGSAELMGFRQVEVDLSACEAIAAKSDGSMRIYPGALDLKDGKAFSLR